MTSVSHGAPMRALVRQLAPWPAATAGGVLVAWSYSIAATRGVDETHYAVFWLGMLTMAVPTFVIAGSPRTSTRTRLTWTLAYAVFTFLPKLLRNPSLPLFHDEIAHWRQAVNLAATGKLFQPNPTIGIISQFPGLHIVTAAISDTTGLDVWQSAELLIAAAHVATLLGAVALGEAVLGSARAGVLVGLFYSFNSSFLYFDTEYGYESLAIAFFVWCLACVARAHQAETRRERLTWATAAAFLGCGVVPIHHLTALILVLALSIVSLVTALARRRAAAPPGVLWPTFAVTALVAASIATWIGVVAPSTISYLSPYFGGGLSQLTGLWSGAGNGRSLYSATTEPSYEQLSAFASPLVTGFLALAAIIMLLRRRQRPDRRSALARWSPMRLGLGVFGLLYFPSVPFILTTSGAEGARRSWAFTYLGLAVLIAPVALAILDSPRWRDRDWWRRAVRTAAVLTSCMLLVGNVSAGLDEDYRFPGPYVFGSDTRSITPELVATADWFAAHIGVGRLIVTDRYTGLAFVRDADSWTASPSAGFPAYDLYFHDGRPSPDLIGELSSSHYAYLIIDRRMALELPAIGVFFEPDEPFAYGKNDPISVGALEQYENYPWTTLIYQSDDYSIYRFDFSAFTAQVTGGTR